MAVTLNTTIGNLLFSSAIPDLVLTTSDDNEAEVILRCPDMAIFSAVHFPYSRSITIHDLRSVVELYMRERNLTLDEFELLAVHNGTQQTLATFKVVYLEHHFDGDIEEFLRNNFLTTQSAKLTSRLATEYLYFFAAAGEDVTIRHELVVSYDGGEPRLEVRKEFRGSYGHNRIEKIEVTYPMMMGWVTDGMEHTPDRVRLLAYSLHAGQRAFTFYVQDSEPPVAMYFRNAYNCYELCALHAVTTHKPKVDRSIAVTNRISTFYNQQNEKQYEVETSGLTMEQARWIEQLFYSHDVRMATKRTDYEEEYSQNYNPQYMPIVLITDFTCEIHDRNGELNTVKFTYQYSDRRPLLPTDYLSVDHERIFTDPYNPSYG